LASGTNTFPQAQIATVLAADLLAFGDAMARGLEIASANKMIISDAVNFLENMLFSFILAFGF